MKQWLDGSLFWYCYKKLRVLYKPTDSITRFDNMLNIQSYFKSLSKPFKSFPDFQNQQRENRPIWSCVPLCKLLFSKEIKSLTVSNSEENTWKSVHTKTCHTFSLAPSKLQNRMLTPNRPCPPHMLLGVTDVSLSSSVLLLYTSIFTGFSTFAFNKSLRVSLSLFCECSNKNSD